MRTQALDVIILCAGSNPALFTNVISRTYKTRIKMKRFKDLTEFEINDLCYDDLEKYILIECAENGVEIIDCPTIPKYEAELEKDDIYYSILGHPYIYLQFSDLNEVSAMVKLLNSSASIKSKPKDKFYSVEKKLEYSDKTEKENEKIQSRNKLLKSDYEELQGRYDSYIKKRDEFADPIIKKYNNVHEKYARLDMIKRKYNETYLPLVNNDETIAKRFLKDAFVILSDDEEYIFS